MTREEAIKVAIEMHGWLKTDREREALETLIPELADSEDERIRKELIWMINECTNWAHKKEYIAYLEKQKEQNSVDEQFPPLNGLDAIKAKYYDDGFKNGFDEGVASVKPAEWSEEDEKDMAHIIRILNDCYVYAKHDLSKTDHENLVNKLKSLRPSWKPSKEQMKALYDACCIAFEEERDFHPSLSRLYHDLRKL